MKQRKINVEALPTEDAIASYNYLCAEDRAVGAVLIPPEQISKFSDPDADLNYAFETNSDRLFEDMKWKPPRLGDSFLEDLKAKEEHAQELASKLASAAPQETDRKKK